MKYKVGEVSKILDIPVDTLRYLEKRDIVHPDKDDNNYRYYDAWDINFLIEYKKFRSYDFSSAQVEEILYVDDLCRFKSRFIDKQQEIEEKIKYYTMLKKKNQEYLEALENIDDLMNSFKIDEIPELYYFTHRYNYQYETKDKFGGIFEEWMEHMPFVEPLVVMTHDSIINRREENKYKWGFSIGKEYADAFDISLTNRIVHVEKAPCVHTVVCAGERGTFSIKLLEGALEFMKVNNYRLCGDVVGRLLARVHEKTGYCRYIEIWLPIKKD